jgi:hypothetical protein
MDPVVTSIVLILGKYALDKGVELGKEVGPKALETAREMFGLTLDHLRKNPKGEVIASEFEKDPDTYQKPMEKVLAETAQADPDFVAQLKDLLAKYEEAAREHTAAMGTTYQATLKGSGAIAQGKGAVAAGKRGVAVGRDVTGSTIITGDSNVVGGQTKEEKE